MGVKSVQPPCEDGKTWKGDVYWVENTHWEVRTASEVTRMHSGFTLIMAVNRKEKTKWCTSIKVTLSIDPLFTEMAAHNG